MFHRDRNAHPVGQFGRADLLNRQKRSVKLDKVPRTNGTDTHEHADDVYTSCSPYDENCNLKRILTHENQPENDKFSKIINYPNERHSRPSNRSSEIRHKRSPRELHQKYGPNFWKNYPDLFFHLLKVNRYNKRKPTFHGDVFDGEFGDFEPLRKRRPEQDGGLEHGVFNDFGSFNTLRKRVPEISSSGFHSDVFNGGFGNFETLKKRVPEGFRRSDVFNSGFRNFETLRKRVPESVNGDAFNRDFGQFTPLKRKDHFDTVIKRRPDSEAVNGDAFHSNFGDFQSLKRDADYDYIKRKMSSELDADAFHNSFGNFEPLKKRKPISGFEDAFHHQFGNFDTLRKRKVEDINSDAFHSNFGNFNTMKRKPEMLNGDAFHSKFGSFDTLRKRVPEINSGGFHENVFTDGFGNFDVSKRTQRNVQDYREENERDFKNLLQEYARPEVKPHNATDSVQFNVHSNSSIAN